VNPPVQALGACAFEQMPASPESRARGPELALSPPPQRASEHLNRRRLGGQLACLGRSNPTSLLCRPGSRQHTPSSRRLDRVAAHLSLHHLSRPAPGHSVRSARLPFTRALDAGPRAWQPGSQRPHDLPRGYMGLGVEGDLADIATRSPPHGSVHRRQTLRRGNPIAGPHPTRAEDGGNEFGSRV